MTAAIVTHRTNPGACGDFLFNPDDYPDHAASATQSERAL